MTGWDEIELNLDEEEEVEEEVICRYCEQVIEGPIETYYTSPYHPSCLERHKEEKQAEKDAEQTTEPSFAPPSAELEALEQELINAQARIVELENYLEQFVTFDQLEVLLDDMNTRNAANTQERLILQIKNRILDTSYPEIMELIKNTLGLQGATTTDLNRMGFINEHVDMTDTQLNFLGRMLNRMVRSPTNFQHFFTFLLQYVCEKIDE